MQRPRPRSVFFKTCLTVWLFWPACCTHSVSRGGGLSNTLDRGRHRSAWSDARLEAQTTASIRDSGVAVERAVIHSAAGRTTGEAPESCTLHCTRHTATLFNDVVLFCSTLLQGCVVPMFHAHVCSGSIPPLFCVVAGWSRCNKCNTGDFNTCKSR